LFDELLSPVDVQIFFTSTLLQIAKLSLNPPFLLQSQSLHLVADLKAAVAAVVDPSPPETTLLLRLLRTQQAGVVLLRQELVASLLACSFPCLFPTDHRREEQLGRINFDKLFAGVYERGGKKKNENKLRCLLYYFDRVCSSMPQGTVSFERKVLPKEAINDAIWGSSGAPLCLITVLQEGCIEDDGRDCLQVDFANRLLGGGALGDGCVQVRASFISAILSLSPPPPPPPPFLSILFRRIVASGFRLKLLQSFVSLLPHQLDFELWLQGLD
jgi:poly(ADP-ribose) glycohydrolase